MNRPGLRRFVAMGDQGVPDLIETSDYQEQMYEQFDNVEFAINSSTPEGIGKLFITTARIIWVSNDEKQLRAFDFDVPYITLHAVSRDPITYPRPCLYCQLDDGNEDADNDDVGTGECFFVPDTSDADALGKLFEAFCSAAVRNPSEDDDQGDGFIGEDNDDELIFDVNEVTLGAEEARRLGHLESVFQAPDFNNSAFHSAGDQDKSI
jgi:hypothetical protein